MSRVDAFVDGFLAHYASEYYDPAKAREYYLRTRELKNKRSNSELTVKNGKKVDQEATDRRKQGWAYAKNEIDERKKADLEKASEDQKALVEQIRQKAEARRKEISQKLEALFEALTKDKTSAEERIMAELKRKTDALPPIPKGVSDQQRARIVAARAAKISQLRKSASSELSKVANENSAVKEALDSDARKQLEAIGPELKASVEKARTDYQAGKERLIAEYEARAQKEFDAIRTRVR